MKIASANLQMEASHKEMRQHSVRESLTSWVGDANPPSPPPEQRLTRDAVNLSSAAFDALQTEQNQHADQINRDVEEAVNNDPKTQLIRSVLEFLTGRKMDVFDRSEISSGEIQMETTATRQREVTSSTRQTSAGFGVDYSRHESYSESEQMHFAASGIVRTSDGQEISFKVELALERHYYEESNLNLRLGDAARKTDPLVLNFAGTAAQLSDQRFAFDLNADGQTENIHFAAPGTGFLVFDRNADGKINNGSELFGPATNDGFTELALLDDDRNGWIDENDKSFEKLQIWSQNHEGERRLQTLQAAGVGAIALNRVSTPFSIKDEHNRTQGEIRNSGIFLQENDSAGTISQIDLTA